MQFLKFVPMICVVCSAFATQQSNEQNDSGIQTCNNKNTTSTSYATSFTVNVYGDLGCTIKQLCFIADDIIDSMRSMISQVDYDQINGIIQDAVVDRHVMKKDNIILANIHALHDRHQIFEKLYAQKIYEHDDVMFTSLAKAMIHVCLDMCIIIDLMNDFLSQQSERFELFKDKCESNSSEFERILAHIDTQIMKACQINDGSTCTKQIEEIAMMKDDLIEKINQVNELCNEYDKVLTSWCESIPVKYQKYKDSKEIIFGYQRLLDNDTNDSMNLYKHQNVGRTGNFLRKFISTILYTSPWEL